jgi:rhodanese-related sulfurtransferase
MNRAFFIALLLAAAAPATAAPAPIATVDYSGFQTLTRDVRDYRAGRLVTWAKFETRAKERDTLILDARSADAFAAGHIRGAVNLPFTDFTAESLAQVIGQRDRPILIYCNNNFANDKAPVRMKAAQLALNIQTFINLVGYGYPNVYELGEVIDFNDAKVGWVSGPPTPAKAGG